MKNGNARLLLWIGGAGALAALAAVVVLVVLPLLNPKAAGYVDPELENSQVRERVPVPKVVFRDITKKAGIRFVHNNGSTPKKWKLLPETMGSGVAFLDYDNDGHQDLLFVNSCSWPGIPVERPCTQTLALYHNNGDGTFTDVTVETGLDQIMFGMGVTVGDFDNDGYPDLFITGVGGNRLFRNVRSVGTDGKVRHRFEDVTGKAGLLVDKARRWPAAGAGDFLKRKEPISFPSSAAFLDYDGDGWLDLFVCNYVEWSPASDLGKDFKRVGVGKRSFGPPTNFTGTHCQLFRNKGKDRYGNWLGYEEVTKKAGIEVFSTLNTPVGKAMGVTVCDVDGDGYPDIIVANDTARNFFFHNQRNGTFKEIGEWTYVAYADTTARGGMGIDAGYYRPDRFGVVIGNFANEPNTFLRLAHPKRLVFSDVANNEGIAGPSRALLKFGTMLFDYDLDGRLDLLTCNGQLEPEIKLLQKDQEYRQPVQLFWNTGRKDSSFEEVKAEDAGTDLFQPLVGRGCAYGDIDGDGLLDVVLVENGGPARVLRNEGGTGNHCIRLVLQGDGKNSNTSAIGARVKVTVAGLELIREVTSARGYLSQSELPVTVGLGRVLKADKVEIRWPGKNGGTQVLTDLKADRVYTIKQGDKKPSVKALRKAQP
jgi:hypothetical protein